MGYLLCAVLEHLDFFHDERGSLHLHGANLSTIAIFRHFLSWQEVDALEIYISPVLMADTDRLRQCAVALVGEEGLGRDRVRFYPFQALPQVFKDGERRIFFTVDLDRWPRDRYLRDRFATGQTIMVCDTHAFGNFQKSLAIRRLADAPFAPFDAVACISKACERTVFKLFEEFNTPGHPLPFRTSVIVHSVDTRRFSPASADVRLQSRRLLQLPESGVMAVFFGRITPYDKADLLPLIHSFDDAALPDDCHLLIAGIENVPGYFAKLESQAKALGLGHRIHFRPNLPQQYQSVAYNASDVFVFPGDTIQEARGNTVMEAAASGLPVIISDWDGLTDSVVDGESGILIDTAMMGDLEYVSRTSPAATVLLDYFLVGQNVFVDTGQLTSALRRLMTDSDLRKQMGECGRRLAVERWSEEAVKTLWLDLWKQLFEEAKQNWDATIEERRAWADKLGRPLPYTKLFGHYATRMLEPSRYGVKLSRFGRAVYEGDETLGFYDGLLALIDGELLNRVFSVLAESYPQSLRLSILTSRISAMTDKDETEVTFLCGLLIKRGVIESEEIAF